MSKTIVSSTDTEAEVQAALGNEQKPVEKVEEQTEVEAAAEAGAETETEESEEEVETEEEAELEAKDDESTEKKKPNKKNGFQRRLAKKDREIEYWKREAQKTSATDSKPETATAKPEASKEPNADDFESHADYVKALTKWELKNARDAEAAETKKAQAKSQEQTQLKAHLGRVEQLIAEKVVSREQWEETMSEVEDIQMSLTVQTAILESDDSARLMLELVKDPDEYERICSLPHDAANRAIGRIEARLEKAAQASKEAKVTKKPNAPKPITSLKGKSQSGSTVKPDELDFQAYKKWRAENP